MKFVALALTFLLAAGCQCRFLQADAPSQYEQIRSTVVEHLTQAKELAKIFIDRRDDAELKESLAQSLDKIQHFLESTSESLAPFRSSVGPQIVDYISYMYRKMAPDLHNLHYGLGSKMVQILEVVKTHLKEYQEELDPVIKEYTQVSAEKMKDVREKIKATMGKLEEKLKVNLEETKSKLMPIEATLRDKITAGVKELREMVGPYVHEYKEQIEATIYKMHSKYVPQDFYKKMLALKDDLRPQLAAVIETVNKAFNQ